MSAFKVPPITSAVKLPPSAYTLPASGIPLQVVSYQLGLITGALKSEKAVSEIADTLEAAKPAQGPSDTGLIFLLKPRNSLELSRQPAAVVEKLAAITYALKTGNQIDGTIKLLGTSRLPAPPSASIFNALSTIKGTLTTNNLIPEAEAIGNLKFPGIPDLDLPSLSPEVVSDAIVTVTNTLESGGLVPILNGSGDLTDTLPLPATGTIPGIDSAPPAPTPQALLDALRTITDALIPGERLPPAAEDLHISTQRPIQDALATITKTLHDNDLVADATILPVTILPGLLAQIVSDTLETITAALRSGKSGFDVQRLTSACGLPPPLSQAITGALEKVSALAPGVSQTATATLEKIVQTLKSSDKLLDLAGGPPGGALVAPVTLSVAETLDAVTALPRPVASTVSEILDIVVEAVGGRELASAPQTDPVVDAPAASSAQPLIEGTEPATEAPEVPDADNSTNANPQPDGHKGKRIIICCDGTWQDSDQGDAGFPTNVTRFARALKSVTDDGVSQIIYYQSGVGSSYTTKFGRLIAGSTGLGLSEHVREAFVFISNNYHVQDEIFIFGFSRGAFTARSIAGLIGRIGVLTRRGMEDFGKIYEDYISFRLRDPAYIEKQTWERIKGVTIKVIGCWDTVGSLGIPSSPVIEKCKCNEKYKFHDTDLTPTTENAFHALALDEHRLPFTPTLWRLPVPAPGERHTNIVPNLKQVWFPGVHTNVGGGYKDQELADLTLVWMIDQLSPFLGFDLDYVKSLRRPTDVNNWASGKIFNSFAGVMKATRSKVRTPGGYFPIPPKSVIKRAFSFGTGVFGQAGVASITNEEIHPSVRGRMVASEGQWCSRALFGWSCEKRLLQSTTGPVERWVWKNPESGVELLESNLGSQECVLAGAEVLNKLASLGTVPFPKKRGLNMDQRSVDSKWAEHRE
ncbi:hypothetical protein ABW19_dt0209068 [Dactylella cylindrospora]|nr:hypothetical protein ABW19_dt0209068 [Dactylella cylindrospora]